MSIISNDLRSARLTLQLWPGGQVHDVGRADFHGRTDCWVHPHRMNPKSLPHKSREFLNGLFWWHLFALTRPAVRHFHHTVFKPRGPTVMRHGKPIKSIVANLPPAALCDCHKADQDPVRSGIYIGCRRRHLPPHPPVSGSQSRNGSVTPSGQIMPLSSWFASINAPIRVHNPWLPIWTGTLLPSAS